ncbi:excinuclease ABC subunit UvrB [Malacoplasma iowae]|uniref:UvrABC system protein B n=2 Tax=Malacoplasma iowae TaxID=2116 RepID=A0A084U468_MALIO|nr:excinuclease ABC subunit UvrB [Malacoplasma iowae]VEU63173.1 UvrABC system protein B [Mycoplasmopsis fermentans]EGZ31269.1 excinuclease ABC subunit B [Malacoplasma iowae 695]KFB07754.1 excinuclease ABC subunit B [Malacoplasma iowae DK-CPA]QHG89562.1 excinuclease ABC subunit UvrB [Malacoplasma iowae 695]WPL35659.1 excinuclease ABC subunit UvrB [Malacoplasma iowae]
MKFELVSKYKPSGDQPQAIEKITDGFKNKKLKSQVLVGATGTGKTYTMANIIKNLNCKTLVMAHNKTLAAQLYSEFKEMFPNNKVEYFVSAFDFYQPEAFLPKTNTYIEKNSQTNSDIEMLNISALNSLTDRNDVIVVASVACIYASTPPVEFMKNKLHLVLNQKINIKELQYALVNLNYQRNDVDVVHGKFSIKGDVVEIAPGFTDEFNIRLSFFGDEIEEIAIIEPLSKNVIRKEKDITICAADLYLANKDTLEESLSRIEKELQLVHQNFKDNNKLIEAQRIWERTNHDLDSFREFGYCSGIENYSRHLELREEGQTPYTIFDFFDGDWLLIVDESHMMVPQIRGMYNTDRSRKETLVEYGFRLPSALDNRPLNFDEFLNKINKVLYVSATPNEWEINESNGVITEQIIRPTGLVDPIVEIRKTKDQIIDIENELNKQIAKKQRTFITVMTIRMAEELTNYLKNKNIKVAYLHNELKTLERYKILNNLRKGIYDVVVGINLLREGLDVPEVSLVMILDADKPGFFRSDKSLIQIIGRAARNVDGRVIMYADEITEAMKIAIDETNRRRNIQIEFNKKHNIVPKTIIKPIALDLDRSEIELDFNRLKDKTKKGVQMRKQTIANLRKEMMEAAKKQEYERAAYLRDIIIELESNSN